MKADTQTNVPTDTEYKAIVERNLHKWVDLFIKDEFKTVVMKVRFRQREPFVRHFLGERERLMAEGHTAQDAHKLAIERRDLLQRQPDFRCIEQLVGAGISIPKAIELMEEVRAFDAQIEEAEKEVEAAGEHIESLQEEVELLQDELEDLEQHVETLKEEQEMAWVELCKKYGASIDWQAEIAKSALIISKAVRPSDACERRQGAGGYREAGRP